MKNNTLLKAALIFAGLALIAWGLDQYFQNRKTEDLGPSPEGRIAWETMRLADPATGEIPENIRNRELDFAKTLPTMDAQRGNLALDFQSIGPYNVGGRSRAFAVDVTNTSVYFAGAVSGGMWRSVNAGNSWTKVTTPDQQAATSCIVQDTRPGFTNVWYYGSGESRGNSASKSFSAYYRGSGIYKSIDNGLTWSVLPSTQTLVHKPSDWDEVNSMCIDKTRMDSAIVFASTKKGIMRSNDGGVSWKAVIGGSITADFTQVYQNHSGVLFATISGNVAATVSGLWRSVDGLNWVNITPSGWPSAHERTLIASPDSADTVAYFFTFTVNGDDDINHLWKYEYLNGDGSGAGANWTNLSENLVNVNMTVQGGYSQALTVKPNDPNVVFMGGTSLYRSTSGFQDTLNTTRIGGYSIDGVEGFDYRNGTHYPDQQFLVFDPENNNMLFSTNDGGVYRANNSLLPVMQYDKLNNGYVSAQFYALGIDHETAGSKEVIGGLQDRGTFYSNHADPNQDWISARGADGAYSAISNGGEYYYASTQYANIRRYSAINGSDVNVMPEGISGGSSGGWLFVHPFILDPIDNRRMYLPNNGTVLRNNNVTLDENTVRNSWTQLATVSGRITTIASSKSTEGVVYFGTSSGRIYRLDDAHTSNSSTPVLVIDGITSSGYTSCLAIDPENADRVIAVFSNYNIISLWLTEDGGQNWTPIEGNLKGNPDPGVPAQLYFIGDGPSMRWAEIIKVEGEGDEVVVLGTSVGIFSTRILSGDSTIWKQEGANTVGNVVVDMIDYRAVDGWMVLATHGNGMYAANLTINSDTIPETPEGTEEIAEAQFSVFPNPAKDILNVKMTHAAIVDNISIYSLGGKLLMSKKNATQMDVSQLPSGVYMIKTDVFGKSFLKKFVKI
ncbi:MAG: T9SS type A sorting domain-containing protein [Salibacteraceae bacterium]|nr:T9SS type A sorting domain-containing protein [Salibacteraceae bacterium]